MATVDGRSSLKSRRGRRSSAPRRGGLFRFTVRQFDELLGLGLFDGRRVELIDGVIFEMTAQPPHAIATELVTRILLSLFGTDHSVRANSPLALGPKSRPDPDLAVVVGSPRDYVEEHPTSALLVVEVSDTTLRKDRTLKSHHYARAGIPEYWIVNLKDRQLEVHLNPGPDPARKGRFTYLDITIISADGRITPLARPGTRIAVADLLP